jgi:hypothetical protein
VDCHNIGDYSNLVPPSEPFWIIGARELCAGKRYGHFYSFKEDARRFTDRIPEFLTHFSGVGLPVEVFPYTIKEIMEMKEVGFIKNIQRGKIVLGERGRI